MSTEERDARIRYLSRQGWSVRQIAREENLSKSQVHRVLISSPLSLVVGAGGEDDDGDEDPWVMSKNGPPQPLEIWPPEPLTFVGGDREWQPGLRGDEGRWVTVERWVDGNGESLGDTAVDLYRYQMHVQNELGDYERAAALACDLEAQREAARRI